MADITKCVNAEKCPKHQRCYRHTAPSSNLQSYAAFYKPDEECQHFMDNSEHR